MTSEASAPSGAHAAAGSLRPVGRSVGFAPAPRGRAVLTERELTHMHGSEPVGKAGDVAVRRGSGFVGAHAFRTGVLRTSMLAMAALVVMSGPASAQSWSARVERDVDQVAEALAERVERHAEAWAEQAEKWAEQFEKQAERLADTVERRAEKLAARIEARVEAFGQDSSEAERRRRELEREHAQRDRDLARDQAQRQRQLQQEQSEEIREQQQRQAEQMREQQQRQRDIQRERAEQIRERQREQAERQREQRRDNTRNWPEVSEQFSRTVRFERTGVVDIENISGDIVITGGGGTDVRIDATKRVRNPRDGQARALLQELQIDIAERARRIEIRTRHPRARMTMSEVAYTLAIPSGVDVVVRTISGDLRISNVRGELQAEAISGDVALISVGQVRMVKTVAGNIEISDSNGDVTASSINGDVILRDVKGRSLALETVSGDLRLMQIDVERATLSAVNGDVDFVGRLAKNGRYEFSTHSGDIRLTPVGTSGFDVEASTFSGDVSSEYVMKVTRTDGGAGRGLNRQIRGSFGDGSATVTLRSFAGDITIVRR
jgi:DUF4097 and DUF4098 domain-containing protein YvlB